MGPKCRGATNVVSIPVWGVKTTFVAAARPGHPFNARTFAYAGVSSDAGATPAAAAPSATSRTASTNRRASDSSL